jgi:PPOX class probable F420-dependent enzyme
LASVYGALVDATLEGLPPWAGALLETESVGHLGLLDEDGRPRVLPVTFAVVEGSVWSAIDQKPKRAPGRELARVRWLRATPSSAFTVDSYSDDWSQLAWVQLLGETAIVDLPGHDHVLTALSARYPAYREQAPQGPLLRLRPERALWWRADG